MTRQSTTLSLAALAALSFGSTTQAQCEGQGDLTLLLKSLDGTGTSPGAAIELTLIGKPGEHLCLACDSGNTPTDLLGLGIVCLDFGPNFIEFIFDLPPSGRVTIPTTIPDAVPLDLLCCVALGLDSTAPNSLAISNQLCFEVDEPCTSGGFSSVGVVARIDDVMTFPVTIATSVSGRAGGRGSESATTQYDPANPPSLPLDTGNGFVIERISQDGNDLLVWTRVDARSDGLSHNQSGRLPNEVTFSVSVDGASTAEQIHTSCSQPLAVGLEFGDFTVTSVVPR